MSEHISRKELKQDRIKETFEHGAEALISHRQFATIVVVAALVLGLGYGGWRFYRDHKTQEAAGVFDTAMKAYQGRVGGAPDPSDPSFRVYPDDHARLEDAVNKFMNVANHYPSTDPGRLARYYEALCLADLERHNQALEELRKISTGRDKELAAMAQYQMAVIYSRTGKTDEAVKLYRALADKPSVLVARPFVLLELADALRTSNPKEATSIYQQIKKDFPDSTLAERADRGLDSLTPKS